MKCSECGKTINNIIIYENKELAGKGINAYICSSCKSKHISYVAEQKYRQKK